MRTPIAILSAAGLVLARAACGTPGGDATASACEAAPSGAASNAVKVTGDFGTAPTVTFDGALSADAAWTAAHVDEDFNREQWGEDELATARRAARRTEMDAAAQVLALG